MLRLKSALNRLAFNWRRIRRWSRTDYREAPAGVNFFPVGACDDRIRQLSLKYNIQFEKSLAKESALECYFVLDLLDQAKDLFNFRPLKGDCVDAGSRAFAYAQALEVFFQPSRLTGIELDAYPLFHNFHSRFSYAQFYVSQLVNARYLAMDFREYTEPCDVLTFFYPFVTPHAHVAWHLPLSHFHPQAFFCNGANRLPLGGPLFMVNHGEQEWQLAQKWLLEAGFAVQGVCEVKDPLLAREENPVISVSTKIK